MYSGGLTRKNSKAASAQPNSTTSSNALPYPPPIPVHISQPTSANTSSTALVGGAHSTTYSVNPMANVNKSLATLDIKKEMLSAGPSGYGPTTTSASSSTNNLIHPNESGFNHGSSAVNVGGNTNHSTPSDTVSSAANAWQGICVRVLPLFNGEGVKGCVEDLNELVSVWMKDTPNTSIPEGLEELLNAGMLTLTSKLHHVQTSTHAIPEESVLAAARVSELWVFFFGTVLPYLQGVFLPIRLIVRQRGGDPDLIDVRRMGLESFRVNVVLPIIPRLEDALPKLPPMNTASGTDISGRLRQMLFILNNLNIRNDPIRNLLSF